MGSNRRSRVRAPLGTPVKCYLTGVSSEMVDSLDSSNPPNAEGNSKPNEWVEKPLV